MADGDAGKYAGRWNVDCMIFSPRVMKMIRRSLLWAGIACSMLAGWVHRPAFGEQRVGPHYVIVADTIAAGGGASASISCSEPMSALGEDIAAVLSVSEHYRELSNPLPFVEPARSNVSDWTLYE